MQALITVGALLSDPDWLRLNDVVELDEPTLFACLAARFREAGAASFLLETAYIDRDFSAAYSAFYATLFHPYLKYCRRVHFFAEDITGIGTLPTAEAVSREMEQKKASYLGFIVLRPVAHAPIGSAVLASDRAQHESVQVDVRAAHPVHLLGADFEVVGFPLTQQDTRVGACAQAAIWMAGRHFHRDHGGPWFSLPDINEVALKPTDNFIARSLPAGSEFLTPDNIVRALRAMDRHPVFHLGPPGAATPAAAKALRPLHEIIGRYLDSGIPVIIGLRNVAGGNVGHAVVATGRVLREAREEDLPDKPTAAELISHFIVHDDQRGVDQWLPVRAGDRTDAYPWTLEDDAVYAVTPLPEKVFMTGEAAETLSRDFVASCVGRVDEYRRRATERIGDDPSALPNAVTLDPSFYAVDPARLVARTYLTLGWRYKSRALRNRLPDPFKSELIGKQFPRYVWVTELSLPDDLRGFDMCLRRVRAHVVVDATGSRFGDPLVVHVPGLAMFWTFDAEMPITSWRLILRTLDTAEPFYPKVRGWFDYDRCSAPPAAG